MFVNRIGILTSDLIAMDYLCRCQKRTFNLEIDKCICQGNFFVYLIFWIYLLQNYFLSISQGYMQNFEKNSKNLICIRVNNFAKPVNFKIPRESSQRKKLKLSRLEYYSLCGKVNFNIKYPTDITIYSFWRTMFGSKVL